MLFIILSIAFGAAIGSFLNVCIYRIPENKSIVFPSSHCPACRQSIRWYDNIPIVSYLVLRGKCRHCHIRIPFVYPLVESVTAAASCILFLKYGFSPSYFCTFLFSCSLIVITFIDLHHQIIPDIISLPGIPVFALAAILFMDLPVRDSLIGIVVGGGILFLVALGYEIIKKCEGMGGGDIKLLAMIGGFLGWQSIFFVLLVSSFTGAIIGISVILWKGKNMKYAIPFGPFLAIAAIAHLFFGDAFFRFLLYR